MKSIIKMYIGPILSTIIISLMCFFPDKIITKIPSIIKIFTKNNGTNAYSYKDYIPAIPKDPIIIWKLSQLEYSLKDIEKTNQKNPKAILNLSEPIIKQAKLLVGAGQMNSEILHKIPEYLEQMDKNSIISRIKGFFNFINFIWIISIIGIAVSIVPAIIYVSYPIMKIIFAYLYNFYNDYIVPFIKKLYKHGFFEIMGYLIAIILIADGMKVNKEWGFFIALTGTALLIPLYYFSFVEYSKNYNLPLNSHHLEDKKDKNDKHDMILRVLIIITLFSLSVNFDSKLYSFATTITFYYLIGFYTGCFGLCYVIGFKNSYDMYKIIITSFFLIIFYVIIKVINVDNKYIELFRSPIQIFGALTYFLGLLIFASIYHSSDYSFINRQIIFVCSLLFFLFLGNFYNLPSLTNTVYVFAVLFLMEKSVDLYSKIKGNIWVLILVLSLTSWMFSLYLHKHSEIIISLFKGS